MTSTAAPNNAPAIESQHDEHSTPVSLAAVLCDPGHLKASELDFGPDTRGGLDADFGVHHLELGRDTDFDPTTADTDVRIALVRHLPAGHEVDDAYRNRPALLLVHGMTDYFFQAHVAQHYWEKGYAVYGLDMRKCGRAWRQGQTWHHVTNQAIYDEDITIAFAAIAADHPSVFVMGHSTGGLNVTMWAIRLNAQAKASPTGAHAQLQASLGGIIGNSPWYGMQFDRATQLAIRYVIPAIARLFPRAPLDGGINPVYGITMHASKQGEWDYNTELKPLLPRKKYMSWMAGVSRAQQQLHRRRGSTGVPTLILRSDKHHFSGSVTEASFLADVILMPEQMSEHANAANAAVQVKIIDDATHDVFLSQPHARADAFDALDRWLDENSR